MIGVFLKKALWEFPSKFDDTNIFPNWIGLYFLLGSLVRGKSAKAQRAMMQIVMQCNRMTASRLPMMLVSRYIYEEHHKLKKKY